MYPPARSLAAMLLGTISIAALHALIPSHWLAFAIVGRARRWPTRRTLTVTLLAGSGHVLLTTALGFVVAFAGKALIHLIPPQAEHAATAGLLIVLGLYFVGTTLRGGGHSHAHHHDHSHEHDEEHGVPHEHDDHAHEDASNRAIVLPENPIGPMRSEVTAKTAVLEKLEREELKIGELRQGESQEADETALSLPEAGRLSRLGKEPTVMGALVLGMTLSPCLDLLSVYVGAASLSWQSLLIIGLTMAATTLGLMTLLVWLTLQGLQRLNLGWLERNEGIAVGGALIALGALLFFL